MLAVSMNRVCLAAPQSLPHKSPLLMAKITLQPEGREMMTSELGTSLYHKMFLVLRDQIDSGRYPPGSTLPSEVELCREFGVSRVTSRRAVAELEAAGVVFRQQGRGTFVRQDVLSLRMRADRPPTLMENFRAFLDSMPSTVCSFDYLPAPEPVRDAIGQGDVEGLYQRAIRVRADTGGPVMQVLTWVREEIGRHWREEDLRQQPLLRLMRRAGIHLVAGSQVSTAVLCEPVVSDRLDVRVGAPLLRLERVLFDSAGQPQMYCEILARPDRFQLRLDLDPTQI